jgi:beta-lactamase class A
MKFITLALPLALAGAPLAAQPQPATAPDAATSPAVQSAAQGIADVLAGKRPAAEVFSPEFLAAVPPEKLKALTAQIAAQFGPLEGLAGVKPAGPASGVVSLKFGRAVYSGPFALGADDKVVNLLLNDYRMTGDDRAAIERDIAALPGVSSALYAPLDGGTPALAVNADRQLALGSAFKLYVLSALARQVEQGTRKWADVVRIDALRSLPSGQMQDWPPDAPVTLLTLATMMISISDNTATDQLIHILGRDALAAEMRASGNAAPERSLPFLTTRELFALKADAASGAKYAAMGETDQAVAAEALAQEIARDPAHVAAPAFTAPEMIDSIEWFASPEDLRRVLARIVALKDPTARQILAVSPSMAAPRRQAFAYVGFKGGSEPGVLNFSWLLQKRDGTWWIATVGWNDPTKPVETATLDLLAQRILALP